MSRQKSTNYGVTGLISLDRSGKLAGNVAAFSLSRQSSKKSRVGRSSGLYARWRLALLAGQLTVTATVRGDVSPSPDALRNETGTITLQFDTGRTCAVPVVVLDQPAIVCDTKTKDEWQVTFTCEVTGDATWTGFGDAVTATAAATGDQEVYDGKLTTYDPDLIADGATMMFDCLGVTASDAGEVAKLAALALTSAPITGLKVRSVAMVSRDPFGITVAITFARTTTAEDIENAGTYTTVDQSGLETVGQVTKINVPLPTAPAGQVVRKITAKEQDDGKIVYTAETGLESVEDERERKATSDTADPNYLICAKRVGLIAATQPETPTAPAGTVFHHVEKQEQEDGRFMWVFDFRPTDSKQDFEFDSMVSVDGSTLDSRAEVIVVQSADAPSAPVTTPFTGAVYTDHRRKVITLATGHTAYLYTYIYSYETNAQRLVRQATKEHLGDWSARASTAALDGTPAAHATLVETGSDTEIHPNGHVLSIKQHGLETDPSKWVREHTHTITDNGGLDSSGAVAKIDVVPLDADAPAGQKVVSVREVGLIDGTTGYVAETGYEKSDEKVAREKTSEHLGDWSARATTTSWAGTPAAHGTLTQVATEVISYPNSKTLTVGVHGLETDPAKWVRTQSSLTADVDGWESKGTFAKIGSEETSLGGLVKLALTTEVLPDGTTGYVVAAGVETGKTRWARENTHTTSDVDGLEDSGRVAKLGEVGTAPAGQKIVATTTKVMPDGTTGYISETGLETSGEKLVRLATKERIDADGEESTATTAAIDEAAPAHGTLTQIATRTEGLPDGTDLNLAEHGVAGPHLEMVRRIAKSTVDPDGIDDEATVATIGSATEGDGTGLELAETETLYTKSGAEVTVQRYDKIGGGEAKRIIARVRGDVDPYEYEKWQDAEVVEVADAAALRTYLTTQFATLQTDVEFHKISGQLIGGGKGLIVKEYTKDEKILITNFEGGLERMKSLGGQVSVVDVVPISSTWSNFTTDYCTVNRVTGTIIYRRRLVTSTWSDALHYAAIGLRNNAELLGVAIGKLQYAGAKVRSSEYVSGNHVRLIDYILRFDSLGFVEDSRVGIGNFHTDADISVGFVTASTLGWTIDAPATADLSFIIT